MNLRCLGPCLVGCLFASISGGTSVRGDQAMHVSETGLAILDTPDAWRAFVSGPVLSFARGADDVLLVGSNRLATFDGYLWRNIDAPGAYGIRALVPSKDGQKIWVGANGLVGFVERNAVGEWGFSSLKKQMEEAGVKDVGEIRHAHLIGDKVVFVGRTKILRWNPPPAAGTVPRKGATGHFDVWDLPGDVRLFPFSDGDTLLIYQTGVGLLRMEDSGPKLWLPEASLPAAPPMVAYLSQPDGNPMAVFTDEIFRRDGERWVRLEEASNVLHGKRALRAVGVANGMVAVGTAYGGVIVIRSDGTVQNVLNPQSGLADLNVDKLWADQSGLLWIGMWTGFARLSGVDSASMFDQRVGFGAGVIHRVLRTDGRLTVVTSQGVYALAPSTTFEPASFTRKEAYFRLLRDGVEMDGQLWVAGSDGLWKVMGSKAVREPDVSSDLHLLATLRALPHGLLFFENSSCKAWLQGAQGGFVRDLHQTLESTPVSTLEDDEGRFWVSTVGGHIRCYTWDNGAGVLRPVAHFQPGGGLPALTARPILSKLNGRILAFTEGGVLQLDRTGKQFSVPTELKDFVVVAAATEGGQSDYWVVQHKLLGATGPQVLVRVESDGAGQNEFKLTPLITPGLDQIGEVVNLTVLTNGGKKELWMGGARALLRLDPARLRPVVRVPSVALQRLRVDSSQLAAIGGDRQTVFAPAVGRLEFSFAAGESVASDGVFFYQTRLEGIENEWSPPQTVPSREFTGLAPGSYVFAARAMDGVGRAGPPLRYGFIVEAPWYRRPVALVAWAVGAVLLVLSGMRWRLRRLKRQAERLNHLVNVRTRELSLSNTAKSEFLENISHEIRNPLNGITGLIDLLDETGLSDAQRAHARSLKECSESLSRVFHEVLNFSKLEYGYVSLEEGRFSLTALLESVCAIFQAAPTGRGSTVTVHRPADFADGFWGDEAKLRTIVGNFVGNAIKYAPGTPVEITVTTLEAGNAIVDLLIEVTDHGRGVPAEEQELIFRKFIRGSNARRSGEPGSGIGLATCRAMARLMGGNIGIESPPGKGATFFVKLPLRRAAAEPPAAVPAAEEANVALPAALIVEDEHYNQIVLAGMVGKLGYQTECVGGSDKALAAAVRRAFDVVFLDIELPLVKGPEVARRLRALPGGSRPLLIGVSANDSREAADRCFAAGMDAFVTKPFSVATLQAAVAGARARRQAGDAAGGPDLDFAALELYAQNVPGGLAGAVTSYSRILREEIAALQQALEDRHSAEAVARAAHRVRSHATVVGAAGVVQAAARLEMAARAGHMADGAAHFSQIQRAAEEIGQLLSEKA